MTERIAPLPAPRLGRRRLAPRLAVALLCLSLAAGPGVQAQTPAPAQPAKNRFQGEPVTLNFVNADIEGVTRAVGAILKKQFVVDPRVRGNITLYSDQPLTPREVYLNYLAALRGLGFTVVEVGGMFKVVPEADAKLQTGTVAVESTSRQGDQVLTQIFRLNHESANSLVAVLRPLISPNNTINANAATNSLVITDYADNLQRIAKIIAAMDVPASDVEVIPLQNATAADLAVIVQRLAAASAAPGVPQSAGAPLIMVDARSNSLIVRAPNPAQLALIRSIVAKLDLPAASNNGMGNIWVVYLKNADAVKLAAVLRAAFSGQGSGGAATSSTPLPASRAANAPGSDQAGGIGNATAATTPVSASAEPSTGGFIQADPATNSLIITAPQPLYQQLRNVIDKLDTRRAQVYIESLIVKVDAEKMADIGIQWQGISGDSNSSTRVAGGTNYSGTGNIVNLTAAANQGAAALAALAVPPGLNIGILRKIGDFWNIGMLARFLETKTDANVLATPNMVSLDNEEAKIVVGQNVPFLTGSYSNTGGNGAVNPFQTIERKDVGLTLRIKPQIGEGGTIRLVIYQENSTVVPSSRASPQGLTTDKSAIETTVVVDDGQIMVLGGLLKDEYGGSVEQVPFLGDLPVLGPLFRTDNRTRTKSNLMVFLRPMVIRNQDDSNRLTMDRYDLMRATQQTAGQPRQSVVMPINEAPVTAPLPAPEPGSPFKSGNVPAPLSLESSAQRGAASAPAAAATPPPSAPPSSARGPVGPQQMMMP
ncbi:MAG TPA: type II secretion system secretin GspD [Burkholderiaceae bacterium]|nr:type II secretion system secretin GspD [Burkholderiaceae bacterium]